MKNVSNSSDSGKLPSKNINTMLVTNTTKKTEEKD